MNKLFEDKMSKSQWEQGMLMRYDTMPPWWWNNSNYLETNAIDYGVRYGN